MLISIFLVAFPVSSAGFSWMKTTNAVRTIKEATKAPELDSIGDIPSEQDINDLRINYDALQAYSRKPDCFKRAASLIRGHCAESDMDEDSRVSAAISMTLCEVATAKHHSLPLECRSFSVQAAHAHKATASHIQGECVDALSRSAQLWSSYSGYMREIPQLCHAFRRWNDIDLARNIYYNATVEKIALLRFILDREKKAARHTEDLLQRQMEIQQVTSEMRFHQEKYRSDGDQLVLQLREDFSDILTKFWEMAQQITSRNEVAEAATAARVEVALFDTLQNHSNALHEILSSLTPEVASRLDNIFLRHEMQFQHLDQSLEIRTQWLDVNISFSQMKKAILQLSDQAVQTSEDLERALQGTKDIQATQAETIVAASDLANFLTQLTDATSVELDKINGTIYDIGQQLQSQLQHADQAWKNCLMKILELIYRADPGSLAYLEQLFSFRLLLTFLGFGWTALRATFSAAATVSVLVFLATRKIFLRNSMGRLVSVFDYPTTASLQLAHGRRNNEIDIPREDVAFLPMLPKRALGLAPSGGRMQQKFGQLQHGKRVSRIPDRLCLPNSEN